MGVFVRKSGCFEQVLFKTGSLQNMISKRKNRAGKMGGFPFKKNVA